MTFGRQLLRDATKPCSRSFPSGVHRALNRSLISRQGNLAFSQAYGQACRSFSYLPMSQETIDVIKATAPVVGPKAPEITATFYPTLFKNAPAALQFFNKANQMKGAQSEALADAVVAYATNIDNLEVLGPAVQKINHRHCALGVTPELYGIVHDNLMEAVGKVLGDAVTPEIGQAWSNAVMALAEIMIGEEEKLYQVIEGRQGGWRGFKEFELVKKEKVAEDTVSFDFAPTDGYSGGFEYEAGQYLSIRLPASSGVEAPRHYTVTSVSGGNTLQCTTRRVAGEPEGAASTYMHKTLAEGDKVTLSAPCGVFTDAQTFNGGPVAFVTAGIGITPALSLAPAASNIKGAIHIDRSADFDGLSSRLENHGINVQKMYGANHSDVVAAIGEFATAQGAADTHFVMCGPMGFMQGANQALKDAGVKHIHYEKFGTGSLK